MVRQRECKLGQGVCTTAPVYLENKEPDKTVMHLRVDASQSSERVVLRLFFLHGSRTDGINVVH